MHYVVISHFYPIISSAIYYLYIFISQEKNNNNEKLEFRQQKTMHYVTIHYQLDLHCINIFLSCLGPRSMSASDKPHRPLPDPTIGECGPRVPLPFDEGKKS